MDTRTAVKPKPDPAREQIELIKGSMPQVYAAVRAKVTEIGGEAYALVRRGARGEPGCFFAWERGLAVGTPFAFKVPDDVAQLIAQFGVAYACMWPESAAVQGGGNGTA
jgi:hypothetical protein